MSLAWNVNMVRRNLSTSEMPVKRMSSKNPQRLFVILGVVDAVMLDCASLCAGHIEVVARAFAGVERDSGVMRAEDAR
jgi:hypothetical protein